MKRLPLALSALVILTGSACGATSPREPQSAPSSSTPSAAPVLVAKPGPAPRVPTRLRLEKLRAPVIPLHLNGLELVPPPNPKVLGWWGSKVGATRGATLLVGHTVHTGGGTFDNLENTKVGSIASVSGVRYVVTKVSVMSKTRLARNAQRLFGQELQHKLVLVTCEDYNPETGHYASNVVVIARPVA